MVSMMKGITVGSKIRIKLGCMGLSGEIYTVTERSRGGTGGSLTLVDARGVKRYAGIGEVAPADEAAAVPAHHRGAL
jgi:hypothetical protein